MARIYGPAGRVYVGAVGPNTPDPFIQAAHRFVDKLEAELAEIEAELASIRGLIDARAAARSKLPSSQ